MPGRCQDGALDGDQGLEFADASGQAPVAGAQEGGVLGAVGCHRGNTEGAGEPVVAVSGVCGFVSFTGLVESGGDPGPGGEVPGGGEATHVCAGFGDDYFGDVSSDPWDGVEAGEGVTKGFQGRLDAGGELGDVRLQGVEAVQVHPAQERVVLPEPPDQCLGQCVDLGAHPALGHLCQDLRVAFPGDQRLEHRPARHAQDVGGNGGDLNPGVFQLLLQPGGFARVLPGPVSYTHLRAHETGRNLVCR